jgi:hypothetical protein
MEWEKRILLRADDKEIHGVSERHFIVCLDADGWGGGGLEGEEVNILL